MKPTLSFQRPRNDVRCRVLAPGWRVRGVADACRSAALAFAWCANAAWTRRELARWLVGPYAAAIAASRADGARLQRIVGHSGPLEETSIRELLVRAHAQVIEALRHCHAWREDPTFARDMVDGGFVIGVVDEIDAIGYAPLDVWNMRLVDRVRSLFVADYLTRPDDYASFTICDGCGGATFDGGESHRETCLDAPPISEIVLRRRRRTLVGIGEEEYEIDLTSEFDAA